MITGPVDLVDDVADISEETTAEASNVAAAAEQQSAAITDGSERVRGRSARSVDLRLLLGEVTVSGSGDETGMHPKPA